MERKKHNVEQNTPEWLAARLGKFTSSQMYRLFTDPRTKNSTKKRNAYSGNFFIWPTLIHRPVVSEWVPSVASSSVGNIADFL